MFYDKKKSLIFSAKKAMNHLVQEVLRLIGHMKNCLYV